MKHPRVAGFVVPCLALPGIAALAPGCAVSPELAQAATPQRPSVSADTSTTAEGTLEVELGVTWDEDDSLSTPLGIKYGAGPTTEVFLGLSPVTRVELGNDDETGFGDTLVGIRHRFAEETADAPSLAIQSTVKLPTADDEDGLGSGEVDAAFALVATRTVGTGALVGYYELGVLGDPTETTDLAHTVAVAGGLPIGGRWGAAAELAGLFVPEEDVDTYLGTVNLTYAVTPAYVLDIGFSTGLESDGADPALLVGFTRNLGPVGRRNAPAAEPSN